MSHPLHTLPALTAESNSELKLAFRLFNRTISQVINPVGWSIVLQIKNQLDSTSALLTASTANGMITVADGLIKVSIPANVFTLPAQRKPYYLGFSIVSATGVSYPTTVRELIVTPKFIV